MNQAQELWRDQARSDHALFVQLQDREVPECHLLHYLQMATEKLSKAYLWRTNVVPPKSHTGFVRFLKALLDRQRDLDRIALILGFGRAEDLVGWVRSVQNLAFALQQMAPAEAGDGPNPEYPWPHEFPQQSPVNHSFPLWTQLTTTGQGQHLLNFVERAITHFDEFA